MAVSFYSRKKEDLPAFLVEHGADPTIENKAGGGGGGGGGGVVRWDRKGVRGGGREVR